jgi:hypothetical protein
LQLMLDHEHWLQGIYARLSSSSLRADSNLGGTSMRV